MSVDADIITVCTGDHLTVGIDIVRPGSVAIMLRHRLAIEAYILGPAGTNIFANAVANGVVSVGRSAIINIDNLVLSVVSEILIDPSTHVYLIQVTGRIVDIAPGVDLIIRPKGKIALVGSCYLVHIPERIDRIALLHAAVAVGEGGKPVEAVIAEALRPVIVPHIRDLRDIAVVAWGIATECGVGSVEVVLIDEGLLGVLNPQLADLLAVVIGHV